MYSSAPSSVCLLPDALSGSRNIKQFNLYATSATISTAAGSPTGMHAAVAAV
jgi:hypothetical protein